MVSDQYKKIAIQFAIAREDAGFTQAQVADYLDVTYQAVSNWETGKSKIDSVSLLRCLLKFNVDIYDFLGKCDFEIMRAVSNNSAERERALQKAFSNLDEHGQDKVIEYANDLVKSNAYSPLVKGNSKIG